MALAVVGSAARGEETWLGTKLVGDIDLAAVVRYPDPWTVRRLGRVARELPERIGLGYFPLYSLGRYRTLEFYEAKRTACVLWGPPTIFERVRIESPGDIPKWEGLRLLLNRAVDCVRSRAGLQPTWYAAVKAYLALAEADLVFAERYVPCYRSRCREIEQAGRVLGSRDLVERVRWATRVKLGEQPPPQHPVTDEHEAWLVRGLSTLMSSYLGEDVTATAGLGIIEKHMCHPAHRVAYLVSHLHRPREWTGAIRKDPIFAVWKRALEVLLGDGNLSESVLNALIVDFERAFQPLPR